MKVNRKALISIAVIALGSQSCFAQGTVTPNSRTQSAQRPAVQPPSQFMLPGSDNLHYSKKIPTNFPLPIYRSNLVKTAFINSTKGVPMTAVANIITKDSPKAVFDWYRRECEQSGWKVLTPSEKLMALKKSTKEFYMLSAFKDQQTARMFFYTGPKDEGTSANVQWASVKPPK